MMNYYCHPTSILESKEIGEGTKIWHFSHILRGTVIGNLCTIGQNVMIGPDVRVGDKCKIQNNVSLYKGVVLEDKVFIGPSVVFTNVLNPRAFIDRKEEFVKTLVREGASIGANSTILGGIEIGRYSLIGAGAVVTKNVQDYALYIGNPARQAGWVCKCGEVLTNEIECQKSTTRVCERCRIEYLHEEKLFKLK